jgi:hypothetical protein
VIVVSDLRNQGVSWVIIAYANLNFNRAQSRLLQRAQLSLLLALISLAQKSPPRKQARVLACSFRRLCRDNRNRFVKYPWTRVSVTTASASRFAFPLVNSVQESPLRNYMLARYGY